MSSFSGVISVWHPSYTYRNKSASKRAQLVPIGVQTVLKNEDTKHNNNIFDQTIQHIYNVSIKVRYVSIRVFFPIK